MGWALSKPWPGNTPACEPWEAPFKEKTLREILFFPETASGKKLSNPYQFVAFNLAKQSFKRPQVCSRQSHKETCKESKQFPTILSTLLDVTFFPLCNIISIKEKQQYQLEILNTAIVYTTQIQFECTTNNYKYSNSPYLGYSLIHS